MMTKWILIFLLFPFLAPAQTAHQEDGHVAYKGKIESAHSSAAELYDQVRSVLPIIKGKKEIIADDPGKKIIWKGEMELNPEQYKRKKLHYLINIHLAKGSIQYTIDSIWVHEKERNGKKHKVPSEDLIKDMDTSGAVSARAEKMLNEIDMRLQELMARLRNVRDGGD